MTPKLKSSAIASPHVLRPYNPREACSIAEAAEFLQMSAAHARRIVERYDIGRRLLGGRWHVSRVGLKIIADGDQKALDAFYGGQRDDPSLRAHIEACGLS